MSSRPARFRAGCRSHRRLPGLVPDTTRGSSLTRGRPIRISARCGRERYQRRRRHPVSISTSIAAARYTDTDPSVQHRFILSPRTVREGPMPHARIRVDYVLTVAYRANPDKKKPGKQQCFRGLRWLRGQDLNLRPQGYEPERHLADRRLRCSRAATGVSGPRGHRGLIGRRLHSTG